MSIQEDRADNSRPTAERRAHPRLEPPVDVYVDVDLHCGSKVQARIRAISPFGGAGLIFDEDPRLEVGNMVSVSHGLLHNAGEVRHVGEEYGKHLVGVRWSTSATTLAIACDPT